MHKGQPSHVHKCTQSPFEQLIIVAAAGGLAHDMKDDASNKELCAHPAPEGLQIRALGIT